MGNKNNKVHFGYKVSIYPTKEQEAVIRTFIDVRRTVWNLGVEIQSKRLQDGDKLLKIVDLKSTVSEYLKRPEYSWVLESGAPAHMNHFTLSDVNTAFNRYLKKISDKPRFKNKDSYPKSFVQRNDMKQFSRGCVHINKLGKVSANEEQLNRLSSREGKYLRPTISCDGNNFYFSIVVESDVVPVPSVKTEPIGIDLGIRTLLTLSNGKEYHMDLTPINPLLRRQNLLSKKLGRAYHEGRKSKNVDNLKKRLLKVNKLISDYQDNIIYTAISDIIDTNPEFIAMENLSVSNMVKNRNLSKSLNTAKFRFIRDQVEYQCIIHGIDFYLVGSKFPSSKLCSSCGERNDPKTSKIYKCTSCGLIIDRDLNASINIRNEFMS